MSRIQSREAGLGLVGVIFWIVVLAIAVALVVKIGPIYYDNLSLQNILQDQARHASPSESAGEILYNLQDRLNVAMIKVNQQDIQIIKNGDAPVKIVANYDRVVPLVGNISLLIHFRTRS
ncbi:DUF4845 domain-containing protein [Acidithiobacillus sp. IBUN Pt1247-S3]|uniref:DUF4845 domain-containing protein n=1 Tax=Acidithiobacillus sp. IBUN Pt1247-S3 TaxID=3166642 RepID=UPI0034E46EB1